MLFSIRIKSTVILFSTASVKTARNYSANQIVYARVANPTCIKCKTKILIVCTRLHFLILLLYFNVFIQNRSKVFKSFYSTSLLQHLADFCTSITVFSITVYKTVITFDAGAGKPGNWVLQPPYVFDVRIYSLSYLRLNGLSYSIRWFSFFTGVLAKICKGLRWLENQKFKTQLAFYFNFHILHLTQRKSLLTHGRRNNSNLWWPVSAIEFLLEIVTSNH